MTGGNLRSNPARAFVIPVLDYSPASEYNILTLLNDLEQIPGEVIVIFNSAAIGDELKAHPRITRYAIMKQNVGVARAWNIGLHMAEAELVHIVNADAHLLLPAVEALEQGIGTLQHAVCVGPQGAFVNAGACKDYHYFDKGSFNEPIQVDAVSGFFFCVNSRLMTQYGLSFDNRYTPCYFEEWDLGLQAKQAGLACWIVPTVAYDHHWSGTIRALRTIRYMGHEETAAQILARNRTLFLDKWTSKIALDSGGLLQSGWKTYLMDAVRQAVCQERMEDAAGLSVTLTQVWPDDAEAIALARFAAGCARKYAQQTNGGTV